MLLQTRTAWGAAQQKAEQFRKKEDGSLIMFSLFIFLAMLMFGGIAVDLMLYENRRTHVQNSTDRAVLAAANLDQLVDSKKVVVDYLAKVGIEISEDDVTVNELSSGGLVTGRQVAVNVSGGFDTVLMNLVGVETLPYHAASEAEESVRDIEVSLVLDISGSMGQNQKLENMQAAAKEFLQDILVTSDDNRVSVSLVPYSTQVSAGPELLGQLFTEHNHDYSHCVNFDEEDFEVTAMQRQRTRLDEQGDDVYELDEFGVPIVNDDGDQILVLEPVPLSQTASFDPWRSYVGGKSTMGIDTPVCRFDGDAVDITPWSNNVTALQDQIDALTAEGNTSIDVAMKWGTALLDPSMNGALNNLIADPNVDIDPEFGARPHPIGYDDALKFIVIMTDGINTTQFEMKDEYKEGPSPYFEENDGDILVAEEHDPLDQIGPQDMFNATGDPVQSFAEVGERDGTNGPNETIYNVSRKNWKNQDAVENPVQQLSWLDAWHRMPLSRRAFAVFHQGAPSLDANHFFNALEQPLERIEDDEKDARLATICQAAKDAEIVVFSIGFEVTDASAEVMRSCASSINHFYRVEGLDIETAFESIANQINQLKLTQ